MMLRRAFLIAAGRAGQVLLANARVYDDGRAVAGQMRQARLAQAALAGAELQEQIAEWMTHAPSEQIIRHHDMSVSVLERCCYYPV